MIEDDNANAIEVIDRVDTPEAKRKHQTFSCIPVLIISSDFVPEQNEVWAEWMANHGCILICNYWFQHNNHDELVKFWAESLQKHGWAEEHLNNLVITDIIAKRRLNGRKILIDYLFVSHLRNENYPFRNMSVPATHFLWFSQWSNYNQVLQLEEAAKDLWAQKNYDTALIKHKDVVEDFPREACVQFLDYYDLTNEHLFSNEQQEFNLILSP